MPHFVSVASASLTLAWPHVVDGLWVEGVGSGEGLGKRRGRVMAEISGRCLAYAVDGGSGVLGLLR